MDCKDVAQIWLCDDLCAASEPEQIKQWYGRITERGSSYGYHIKKGKSYILSKELQDLIRFKKDLENKNLQAAEGTRNLGAPIGTETHKQNYFQTKMNGINEKMQKLTTLAKTSPNSAFYL